MRPSGDESGPPHLFAPQKRMNWLKNKIGYRWLNLGSAVRLPPTFVVMSLSSSMVTVKKVTSRSRSRDQVTVKEFRSRRRG